MKSKRKGIVFIGIVALVVMGVWLGRTTMRKDDNKPLTSDEWKSIYLDYLENQSDPDKTEGYTLIYVNDDAIPELVEVGKTNAIGNKIITISNKQAHVQKLRRKSFTYIEKTGMLCNTGGDSDYSFDIVYQQQDDGTFTSIATGKMSVDDVVDESLSYHFNGEEVTQEEYRQQLDEVYDGKKAKYGYSYGHLESLTSMMALLKQEGRIVLDTDDDSDAEWKKIYLDYLNDGNPREYNDGYALIYINDDDIPELVEAGDCEATGNRIVTITDGKANPQQFTRLNLSYIERSGLVCHTIEHMGIGTNIIVRMEDDGTFSVVTQGNYTFKPDDETNKDKLIIDDFIFEYKFEYEYDNQIMTRAEYEKKMGEVYDFRKEKTAYEDEELETLSTMLEILKH